MTEASEPGAPQQDDLTSKGVGADHSGLTRMGQQLTRGADAAPTFVAGGRAGQPCGQPSPAVNTVNHEQENIHVSN